ncbi:prolyl oligopeptidase family serine peptidase [Solirubrobacter ginsenosidimutans]|uniref:Prolyl oligopeptidase family serine peptidase n=1 Tax=Solirubrobacter ginsenosidimutans TaxID=490573 RepID=A0A9X3N347_9ACTN|nr:prolyl oligopeptidase family serine peptidase [Solirubrobacter ginsenosidimutans]MDA0163973.1 prolyl oligopeptidase family serine peptidase [Solirubrobacter ginsenosidimutans]
MEAPYGTWSSPIDGRAVAEDSGWTYSLVKVVGDDVYWSESRPAEDGRDALVRRRGAAAPVDVIPAGFSARTRVHEYGGGAYTVDGDTVYFCNDADQRVYRVDPGGIPQPITPEPDVPFGLRYADLTIVGESVICVRERVARPEHVNELVTFPTDGRVQPRVIAAGHDFYAAPRISPSGAQLAWLTWDHPRMPWEGSELWTAHFRDGALTGERLVAGGPAEAIVQPEWSPDGVLHFSSDRTGWWNLYRGDYEPVTAVEAEVGGPLWVFDESWYAFLPDGRIVCTVFSDGSDRLAVIDAPGALRYLDLEFTRIVDLTTDGTRAIFAGASPTREACVVAADLATGETEILAGETDAGVDPRYVSVPRPLEYPTTGGKTAHALYFPPHNPDHRAPAGELPPLMVRIHGGPTAHVTARLSRELQFFTSRGFAVVDVNYGGSTGYGREYRDRLHGQWGVVDVDDAVNAALALADAGEVDRARMTITGGSAGGWTVLCALAFHPDVFAAGADYYGVSDLLGFVDSTHKFESRYNDWLVGPWPEAEALWRERSPVNFADRIRAPVIILQGLEDAVVPPSQSDVIVAALRANHVPFTYIAFEGEQHGFRKASTLKRAAEAELAFYGQVLGFAPAGGIEPVSIEGAS